jgi:hypothetical protein
MRMVCLTRMRMDEKNEEGMRTEERTRSVRRK